MAEHAPLHHHLLTMPLSAKNRPPPALLSASAHYLAPRTQLPRSSLRTSPCCTAGSAR
ncbi:hypothetical protein B0H14DRAFT_2954087 [Mycena olivaceomarginata]|nr:hypothetical protein B0H14DRAFT_2954087 [Mycena olivaceomarginata]